MYGRFTVRKEGSRTVSKILNSTLKNYDFLKEMYEDGYYPNFLVEKGKLILVHLCESIKARKPHNVEELYQLTHAATEAFNALDTELCENGSEIETVAREIIATEFAHIAKSYGYEADIEELIAPRDW